MRGEIISGEFQRIEWVQDADGKQYACYQEDVQSNGRPNEARRNRCLDLSQVLGDSW